MITLPEGAIPNSAQPTLLDFGGIIRPSTGAKILRLDRGGNRYRVAMTLPIRSGEDARRVVSRLLAAKSEGLKVEYPLQGVYQGTPGSFVVDGAGQSGNTILLRGGTPHYAAKEGFWLTIHDGDATTQGYLHNVKAQSIADGSGDMELIVTPNLRIPFPNGAHVELAKPTIQGLVDGDVSWSLAIGELVDSLSFVIEEAA